MPAVFGRFRDPASVFNIVLQVRPSRTLPNFSELQDTGAPGLPFGGEMLMMDSPKFWKFWPQQDMNQSFPARLIASCRFSYRTSYQD